MNSREALEAAKAYIGDCAVSLTKAKVVLEKIDAALASKTEISQQSIRNAVVGMDVSVDVSTGEHDSGNRIFGTVIEAMDDPTGKHGMILLVQDPTPNFQPATQQGEQEPVGKATNGITYGKSAVQQLFLLDKALPIGTEIFTRPQPATVPEGQVKAEPVPSFNLKCAMVDCTRIVAAVAYPEQHRLELYKAFARRKLEELEALARSGYTRPQPAIPEVLALAWYHYIPAQDGEPEDYEIFNFKSDECPDCVEVAIVRMDHAAPEQPAGEE